MDLQQYPLIQLLLPYYEKCFDFYPNHFLGGRVIPLFANYHAASGRYFFSQKVMLYEAHVFEKLFFYELQNTSPEEILQLFEFMVGQEPVLVSPGSEHYATYLTSILVLPEVQEDILLPALRQCKFRRSYRFTLHGFSEGRILLISLNRQKVFANAAGKTLVKPLQQYMQKSGIVFDRPGGLLK